MCLIIAPGRDGQPALLPRETFDYVYNRNDDGFGAMWVEDGRVQHFKTLGLTADQIYGTMEEYTEKFPDVIFHMRYKTHGKIIPGLSHPFRILNKKRHGKDLFFMHNGVLGQFGNNLSYGQSDTTVFKDKILVPLLTRDPDALDDPEVWQALEKLTSGSRLIFLDSNGKVYRTSPATWNNRYGLTLSNTYMLPSESYIKPSSTNAPKSTTTVKKGDESYEQQVTSHFIYRRRIIREGTSVDVWCSCPKIGYVRAETGFLYKDNGPNKNIYHAVDYIPKDMEKSVLGLEVVGGASTTFDPVSTSTEFDDDELPWDDDCDTLSSHTTMYSGVNDDAQEENTKPTDLEVEHTGPAPVDHRLRYARLVHNLYGGNCTSRTQLVADLVAMGDDELSDLVREDPGNSFVIVAELLEMLLEANDALWSIDPNHEKILNVDVIVDQGKTEYHRNAMKEITRLRRIEYEKQIEQLNTLLDDDQQQEVA